MAGCLYVGGLSYPTMPWWPCWLSPWWQASPWWAMIGRTDCQRGLAPRGVCVCVWSMSSYHLLTVRSTHIAASCFMCTDTQTHVYCDVWGTWILGGFWGFYCECRKMCSNDNAAVKLSGTGRSIAVASSLHCPFLSCPSPQTLTIQVVEILCLCLWNVGLLL